MLLGVFVCVVVGVDEYLIGGLLLRIQIENKKMQDLVIVSICQSLD